LIAAPTIFRRGKERFPAQAESPVIANFDELYLDLVSYLKVVLDALDVSVV
jgi:hypothetical protein